jgi:transcriptional regulator with XRE-family HTH domain
MSPASLRVVHVDSVRENDRKKHPGPLHRIHEVREQQGVSLRSAARRMRKDMATVRHQEQPTTDLRLTELFEWQEALEVPVADLLEDPGAPLSRPVMERARMLRLMKTAMSLLEGADSDPIRRMAQMLVEQLVEIMPELEEVTAWHTVGQRRSMDEVGRIAECPIPDDFLGQYSNTYDW